MYLTRAEIERSLRVITHRSSPGSHLAVVYHRPAFLLRIIGAWVRRLGEPLRSEFTAKAMQELLAAHGFQVISDDDIATIGARLSPELKVSTERMKHMGVVIARRD